MGELKLGYLNIVVITGRVVSDPRFYYTPSGIPVTMFRIASNKYYRDQNTGEFKTDTSFFSVIAWRKLAERCSSLKKGSAVLIEGSLNSRSWDSPQGRRSVVEIVARRIQFLDKQMPEDEDVETTPKVEEELPQDEEDFTL